MSVCLGKNSGSGKKNCPKVKTLGQIKKSMST